MRTILSEREKSVLKFAILIRVIIIILSILVSNMVTDYDTSDIVLEKIKPTFIGRSLSHW